MVAQIKSDLSRDARAVAERVSCLRDFLDYLEENNQCVTWPDLVMPEPDISDVAVAARQDSMNSPAIIFDKIHGYPGKRIALNVHGSFNNLALLLGCQKGTSIKELFFVMIERWGANEALLDFVSQCTPSAPCGPIRLIA
jgi:4-hydroxybenzoate decarboxylase